MKTVGLRIRSGFAVAVVASGTAKEWHVGCCRRVMLTDEAVPFARSPFHPLVDLDREEGELASRRAVATVQATSRRQMEGFLKAVGPIGAAAIVVGSLADPDTISNPHIRVHAREAELFRGVVAEALDRAGVPYEFLREVEAYLRVSKELHWPIDQLRAEVSAKGRGTVKPWRADEKLAALGGLWKLSGRRAAPAGSSGGRTSISPGGLR
jgi:hypothetical protein